MPHAGLGVRIRSQTTLGLPLFSMWAVTYHTQHVYSSHPSGFGSLHSRIWASLTCVP